VVIGVAFATLITLFLLPMLYLIVDDIRKMFRAYLGLGK
jgi:predicted RND superfamily exporter protein